MARGLVADDRQRVPDHGRRGVGVVAVEQQLHWQPGRRAPGYNEQCAQLTAARAEHDWLAAGSQTVQQQALRDFAQAMRENAEARSQSRLCPRLVRNPECCTQPVGYAHLHIPALLLSVQEEFDSVMALRVDDGLITGMYIVRNPHKLSRMEQEVTLSR